ncbi:hypothetical protein Goari_021904 [Gossypium aridum]|uniref:Uncharacterized protein n=1 Tax=Gossypium aridum TaxID=34290 RepID=A0A7J8YMF3_GOSAI|nr:hypothetical protein [Gossypium aridum]
MENGFLNKVKDNVAVLI